MSLLRLIVLFSAFSFLSCKKDRTCECTNSNGTYDAGTVEKTKSQAKRYCKSLSSGATTCQLKN